MTKQEVIDQVREFCELSRGAAEREKAAAACKHKDVLFFGFFGKAAAFTELLELLEEIEAAHDD